MATPETLREEASAHYQEAEASFDRCDTDGFLSQWAHGVNGQKASMEATLLEDGGMACFRGLFDGERRLAAKMVDGQFGTVWLLTDEEVARYGRRFIPIGRGSRVQKAIGLHEDDEMAPAIVKFMGSSLTSVRPCYIRTDGGYPGARQQGGER